MDLAATSTEYLHVGVTATISGSPVAVPVPPKFAFLDTQNLSNPDTEWITGEWAGTVARILLGPNGGALTLEPGAYKVWISFAAGAETPVRRIGTLNVY